MKTPINEWYSVWLWSAATIMFDAIAQAEA
jgi:hypothetical protein